MKIPKKLKYYNILIFKHSIPDNIEITLERSKVIAIAILDKLNINSGENIYIIDPYFEPKSHLFDYISKNTYDDGVWPFIIKFMVENINKGQIQILTSYTLEHLIEVFSTAEGSELFFIILISD